MRRLCAVFNEFPRKLKDIAFKLNQKRCPWESHRALFAKRMTFEQVFKQMELIVYVFIVYVFLLSQLLYSEWCFNDG